MTSEFEDEAVIVAYHEAGHATMAIACGFKLTALSVNVSDVGKGFVAYQIPALGPVDKVRGDSAISSLHDGGFDVHT
ncbi:hypothetical protein G6L12_31415 [Agrobacterium rhizogenes]|nr:hypothetical protein [Rhizobium rhizogenes]NTF79007.1 hypothetical protein [Rhizobium rhizogenes]